MDLQLTGADGASSAHLSWEMEQEFQRDRGRYARAADRNNWQATTLIYADWLEERGRENDAAALRALAVRDRMPVTRWPTAVELANPDLGLSEHQQMVLGESLIEPVGIFVGSPGTGKTHTLARLLRALQAKPGSGNFCVCAPTGKAAVRATEMANAVGVRGHATTVHQLLGIGRNGHDGDGWGFIHNADNPLPFRIVVVEEASMLDTHLAASLFGACRPGTHVLLVGDPDQLPPVGHGAPLRDLIASGVPCGRLTEVRRNSGLIVEACAAIRRGESFELADKIDYPSGRNLRHIEAGTPSETLATLPAVVNRLRDQVDVRRDVQVICAANEKGDVARSMINLRLQHMLKDALSTETHGYHVNDKVLCTKNGWYPALPNQESNDGTLYVANGELGQVVGYTRTHLEMMFTDPQRIILVSCDGAESQGRTCFTLGWAITGHKSQGAQWPVTIIIVDDSAAGRQIAGREWWYTVLSRAQRACITIGRREALMGQVRRGVLGKRKTMVVERMRGGW